MDIKTLADGLNNALYIYGYAIRANYLGCDNPLPQKLRELPDSELQKRYDVVAELYNHIIELEKQGHKKITIDKQGGKIHVDC